MLKRYVKWVIRFKFPVIGVVILVSVFFGYQTTNLQMDIVRKNQLPQSHPVIQIDNRISALFGGSRIVLIGIVPKGKDVFKQKILNKIKNITDKILEMPGVIKRNVLSLSAPRIKDISGTHEGVKIKPLMETVPTDEEEIENLKKKVFNNKDYIGLLVTEDSGGAAIIAEFEDYQGEPELTNPSIHNRILKIVDAEKDGDTDFYIIGETIWLSYLDQYTRKMSILFLIALIIIGIIHYEAFRTLQALFLPLITAILSVIWSMGLMGLCKVPMDTWNSMTPILILAVAAGHAVQILKRYYEEYDRFRDNNLAIIESTVKVGIVMIMAGLIASAGFASLVAFGIRTVQVFGLFSAVGILCALIIEMTFIPACRAILPPPKIKEYRHHRGRFLEKNIEKLFTIVSKRPMVVVLLWISIVLIIFLGIINMRIDNTFVDMFPKESAYRSDYYKLANKKFAGSNTMNILVEGKPDTIKEPKTLQTIAELQDFLEKIPGVGKTQSIADVVRKINQAMNENDPSYYRIPESKKLIAQYLLLYSMSGDPQDIEALVNSDYSKTVIRTFTRWENASFAAQLIKDVKDFLSKKNNLYSSIHYHVAGGSLAIALALNETIIKEKVINIIQILIIIFIIVSLIMRSFLAGIFVLIPSSLSVLINLGIMGLVSIPLSLSTATSSALTISIGADYAIYFIMRLREEINESQILTNALWKSMLTTGKAIFFVSSAIAAGYFTLVFADLVFFQHLGGIIAISMLVSSFAAITILPSLILISKPRFIFGGIKLSRNEI